MNPWIWLGVLLAALGLATGVGVWQNKAGHVAERVTWQAQQNKDLAAANAKIVELEERNRRVENQHADMIAAIGEAHEKDRTALEALRLRDVAAARDGRIVLRVPGGCQPVGNPAPKDPAPSGERDVAQGGQLPPTVAADLLALADDADSNTVQLAACQAVIRSYLKE